MTLPQYQFLHLLGWRQPFFMLPNCLITVAVKRRFEVKVRP